MRARNHYEVLELRRGASTDEVRAAYRRLVRRYHPDLNPDDEGSLERIKEVNAAYEVLCDPCAQAQYDRELECAERGASYRVPVRQRPEPIYYEEHNYVGYGPRSRRRYRRSAPIVDVTDSFFGQGYGQDLGREIDELFEAMSRLMRGVEAMDAEADEMVFRMLRRMRRWR